MTERERWIVYPLLFLAIGAALRDKLFDRTTSKSIVCQELIVVDDDRGGNKPIRILARIGGTEHTPSDPAREGQMFIDGQLLVEQLRAGSIVADNFAYRGIPFAPTLRAIVPGVTPADVLRALQQAAGASPDGTVPIEPPEPPTETTPDDSTPPDQAAPPAEPTGPAPSTAPAQPPAQSPPPDDET
jgi:hypothetical protein